MTEIKTKTSPFEADLIKNALKKCRTAFFWLVITSFAINILMLVQSLYMLQIFTRVLSGQRIETLVYLTFVTLIAVLVLFLLMWVRSSILQAVSRWLNRQLLPAALVRCPDQLLKGVNYGSQSIVDISQIVSFINSGLPVLLDVPWIPIYIFVIALLSPWLGLIALVGGILLVVFAVLNEYWTRAPYQDASQKNVRNQRLIDTTLRNSETIQAMGMMEAILKNWQKRDEEVQNELAPTERLGNVLGTIVKFLRLSLQILIVAFGAFFVLENMITPGAMIAASILLGRAYAPLENAMASWQQFAKARLSYKRISLHLKEPSRREEEGYQRRPIGALEVQDLYYLTSGQTKPLLENVSFKLEPGEIAALIGHSGAGKTTLARLLVGVYEPTRGQVRLDNSPVFRWNRKHFGQHVGYLPQDIELFEGSVAFNISRLSIGEKSDITKAAENAHVHEQILRLNKGYETEVGIEGSSLSGGMRQRVALARALYGNPTLIVLDEPNSNLDEEGTLALIKTLQELKEKKVTVLLITHHRLLLQLVDKILVMQQGRLVAFGPSQEILQKLQTGTQPPPKAAVTTENP